MSATLPCGVPDCLVGPNRCMQFVQSPVVMNTCTCGHPHHSHGLVLNDPFRQFHMELVNTPPTQVGLTPNEAGDIVGELITLPNSNLFGLRTRGRHLYIRPCYQPILNAITSLFNRGGGGVLVTGMSGVGKKSNHTTNHAHCHVDTSTSDLSIAIMRELVDLAARVTTWVDRISWTDPELKQEVLDIMKEDPIEMSVVMATAEDARMARIEHLLKRKHEKEAQEDDPERRALKKVKQDLFAAWNENVKKAKERHQAIMNLAYIPSDYSNPTNLMQLPFPSINLYEPNDRFHVNLKSEFQYMGREKFAEVYKTLMGLDPREASVDIFGTSGYGKSFILAALATHLHQHFVKFAQPHTQRTRIVYLPSCEQLVKYGPNYLRLALMLAYADDDAQLTILRDMSVPLNHYNRADLAIAVKPLNLFISGQQASTRFIFIVDQYNELNVPKDHLDSERRAEWKAFLNIGVVVKGASTNAINAKFYHHSSHKSPAIFCHGGLTTQEWQQWKRHWADQQPEDLSDEDSLHMEFQTGLLPYHLRQLEGIITRHKEPHQQLVNGLTLQQTQYQEEINKINGGDESKDEKRQKTEPLEAEVKKLGDQLKELESRRPILSYEELWTTFCEDRYIINIRAHIEDQRGYGKKYIDFLRHCLLGITFAAPPELYDHRYFYADEHGRMKCINGMVKDIATTIISSTTETHLFEEKSQLISSIRTEQNPSSKGFLVERACIGGIFLNGLTLTIGATAHIFKPSKLIYFSDGCTDAVLDDDTFCVLYVPTVFNYKGVDAILRILPKKFVPIKSSGKAGQKEIEAMQALFNPAAANVNTHSEFILVGIQITISSQGAASHPYSIPSFFSAEASWLPSTLRVTPLPNPLVMGRHFCWILPKKVLAGGRQSKNVPAGPKSLRQSKKEKDNAKPAKSIQVQSFEESMEICETVIGDESVLS